MRVGSTSNRGSSQNQDGVENLPILGAPVPHTVDPLQPHTPLIREGPAFLTAPISAAAITSTAPNFPDQSAIPSNFMSGLTTSAPRRVSRRSSLN
jgi:hypothetical protein